MLLQPLLFSPRPSNHSLCASPPSPSPSSNPLSCPRLHSSSLDGCRAVGHPADVLGPGEEHRTALALLTPPATLPR